MTLRACCETPVGGSLKLGQRQEVAACGLASYVQQPHVALPIS